MLPAFLDTVWMRPLGPPDRDATPDLDGWSRDPALRTRHRREARADAAALWNAALTVRLRDCRLLGRLVRARLGVADGETTFDRLFRTPPFVLLEEAPTWALSGLCGRIWTVRGDLATLADAQAFRDWREPGTVRVLFAHWVEPLPGGRSSIHSEVRVAPVDRRAARYMRALEPLVAAFQSLIGKESLALAVRRAERLSEAAARGAPPPAG